VTEYILVLVVVVGIALGVLYQLNTAFKKYVQSYFGDYVACLLETGELPSFGGGDGASAQTCSANFEPFSLKNGRPFAAGGDGGKRGGSGGRRKFARSSKPGAGGRSRSSRNGNTLNADSSGSGGAAAGSVSASDKKTPVRGGTGIASGKFKFRTARMRGEEQIRLDSRFVMGGQKEKEESSSIVKEVQKNPNEGARARKIAVNMDAFSSKDTPIEPTLDMSAGDYLRYMLIFAILVGIFVFFGGQLNQLRKSWDSGD
jgi:hypothetical protein